MPLFNGPDGITVRDFFSNYAVPHFQTQAQAIDPLAAKGKNFTVQYEIDEFKYCMKVTGGTEVEVIDGGIETPMLILRMSEDVWRASIIGKVEGVLDRFVDPSQITDPVRFDKLTKTKGTLNVKLKTDDGEPMSFSLIFGASETPSGDLSMRLKAWVKLLAGKANGPMLFMTGKLRFKGELPFLLRMQSLM